ncbi:MAG: efflux RND transporter periplasmic adaptor subunit, partial [Bacteroidales bacterium]|nr:efflux RND transporter periplasmic adaptor subunit [Bacteroidales bacterium]
MKRTLITTAIVIVAITIALFIFNKLVSGKDKDSIFAEARQGLFEVTVSNAGELLAETSLDIKGPEINQTDQGGGGGSRGPGGRGGGMMRAMSLEILDIVPEGTIVKEGDYVAQLDRSDYQNTLTEAMQNLTTLQTRLDVKILDTAVTLSALRDEITNLRFQLDEARITLEESKYEPPATQRKAEINLNKQERALEQKIKSYTLRRAQSITDIRNVRQQYENGQKLVNDLQEFLAKFTITAPAPGIVMYKTEFNGAKRKSGSELNPFDLVVATIPDLSTMISKTYVSEIEVTRIKPGMKVNITIDALPGKIINGSVTTIANVGEVLPNSDAKMFEVLIKIDGTDNELRPAMTTWNKIIINSVNDAIYIPLECVHTGSDSIPFVVKKNKTRQIVVLGDINDKNVIVKEGLDPGAT